MKKTSTKLAMTVSSMALSVGIMGFAVLAATSQSFTTSGSIGFQSSNVSVSLAGQFFRTTNETDEILSTFSASATAEDSSLTNQAGDLGTGNNWDIGDQTFNGNGDVLSLRYVFVNTGTERLMEVAIKDNLTDAPFFGLDDNTNFTISKSAEFDATSLDVSNIATAVLLDSTALTATTATTNTLTLSVGEGKGIIVEFAYSIKDEKLGEDFNVDLNENISMNITITDEDAITQPTNINNQNNSVESESSQNNMIENTTAQSQHATDETINGQNDVPQNTVNNAETETGESEFMNEQTNISMVS